jgi:hypothetical protein
MEDTYALRMHFGDGTSALSGTIGGGKPDLVDATFARDVNAGWTLGAGVVLPDGRRVSFVTAELCELAKEAA